MKNYNKNVILILLDAFRGDYINKNDTPNIFKLSKKSEYISSLRPSFGFCERTEILTGKSSKETGYFTAIAYDPINSPYKDYKNSLIFFSALESIFRLQIFKKIIRRIFWEIFKNREATFYPFNIPFNDLSNLSLTEDGVNNLIENSDDSVYKKAQGVFKDATTDMSSPLKGDDKYRLNLVLDNLKNTNFQFYPIYVSRMDSIGHQYGPNSDMTRSSLKYVDKLIFDFINAAQEVDEDCVLVLCGDHGMTDVANKINLEKSLLKMKKDNNSLANFNYFLDSTIARFWFNENQEQNAKTLSKIIDNQFNKFGKSILLEDFENNDIPKSRKYGDLVFICNPGTIISPDFFNLKSDIRGMHGYKTFEESTYGFCITLSKNTTTSMQEGPLPLTYVHSIISKHLYDVSDPISNER
tara:strand:- start:5998 stop:7230 length:1233 start_codon:yes stop_codon:yes gene_type:complete